MKEEVMSCIKSRRSIRRFQDRPVPQEMINEILESAQWSPSAHNNQPWRVVVVRSKKEINELAELSGCKETVIGADVLLAVYLDSEPGNDRTKDIQSCGSFCQTALLTVHALGLGGVWVGRILANSDKVSDVLKAPPSWELMAVLCIGWPDQDGKIKDRKQLGDFCYADTTEQSLN